QEISIGINNEHVSCIGCTDYKETMVDVGTLKVPDKEKAIGQAEHFLKFVNSDAREAIERGMRERGFLK
ncbi:MAG: hypothetical protein MJ104_01330, partial [Lachnospiraceae bacterium]|nr:hypothetical protein [Lachnospiraceae bacterium]